MSRSTERSCLSRFRQIGIDAKVAEIAVTVRRRVKIHLPDAIIWTSAQQDSAPSIGCNAKDSAVDALGMRIPYTL
jgi:hypothetical protein